MNTLIKIAAALIGTVIVGTVGYIVGATHMYVTILNEMLETAAASELVRERILAKFRTGEFEGKTFEELSAAIQEEVEFQKIASQYNK